MKAYRNLVVGVIVLSMSLLVTVAVGQPARPARPAASQPARPAPPAADQPAKPAPPAADQPTKAAAPAARGVPNIEFTKKCPGLRYVGRDATFELELTNRGTGAALNVVVTDTLPTGVEFLNADNNGKREGQNVLWQLGNLDPGQSRTLKINVRCNQITTVRNTAKVTYCAESQAECEFPVKGIAAILLECVDEPDPIEVGGQTTYTVTVTNQGSETGTNILVECTLPAEEEFVNTGGATQGKAEGKTVRFAPLATLAPKAKAVFTVTVKGVKEGDARFRIELTSDQIKTPVMETESTHVY
jgi:uncharacterized repeat protein (TIGR01451 family)